MTSLGNLDRFSPEPKSTLSTAFQKVLGGVSSFLGSGATSALGINADYQSLINKQLEVQQQMQLVSLHSNIEKSKHESRMAAIRNVRTA